MYLCPTLDENFLQNSSMDLCLVCMPDLTSMGHIFAPFEIKKSIS